MHCPGVQKLNGYVMSVFFVGHTIRTVQMNLSSFLAHSPNCSKKLEKCSIRSAFSFPELRVPERLAAKRNSHVCVHSSVLEERPRRCVLQCSLHDPPACSGNDWKTLTPVPGDDHLHSAKRFVAFSQISQRSVNAVENPYIQCRPFVNDDAVRLSHQLC